jgi:hypothetical protein
VKGKRNQKFIGGFMKELKAKVVAQGNKNPATLSMPTIGQLDNYIERGLYGTGGGVKKKQSK